MGLHVAQLLEAGSIPIYPAPPAVEVYDICRGQIRDVVHAELPEAFAPLTAYIVNKGYVAQFVDNLEMLFS